MLGSFLRDIPNSTSSGVTGEPGFGLKDIPTHAEHGAAAAPVAAEEEAGTTWGKEPEEFEVVMGRKQIASVSFVVLVTLTVFSSVSYLAGRWTIKAPVTPVNAPTSERKAPRVIPPVTQPDPTPVQAAVSGVAPARELTAKEPPIFGEPIKGSIYLQLGAVDKGMANVMVNGLRRLGFPSIISAGPNDRVFRVLVGPLADSATAHATSRALEAFGISHFAKRIDESPAKSASNQPDSAADQPRP